MLALVSPNHKDVGPDDRGGCVERGGVGEVTGGAAMFLYEAF